MIYVLLANGFEESEAIVPIDLMRRAGLDVTTVAVTDNADDLAVNGAHAITVAADIHITKTDCVPEAVVLPGGMAGAKNLDASHETEAMLKSVCESGGVLAAICAAPMVLGKRGYLKGKRATCYPGIEVHLDGADFHDTDVVTDGNVITGRAMGAAYAFGYALITRLVSAEAANAVKRSILG